MKRSAFLAIVLAVLSLGCVAAAHAWLLGTADRVDFRETVYAGDPSAAEGITLTARQSVGRQLFWDSSLPLAAPGLAQTAFEARSVPEPEGNWYTPLGLMMGFYSGGGTYRFGSQGVGEEELRQSFAQRPEAEREMYLAAAERTGAGETHTEAFRLRDYIKSMPLFIHIDLGEAVMVCWKGEIYDAGNARDPLLQRLNAYFRFPVPEDLSLTVKVTKNDRGQVTNLMSELSTEDLYLDSSSVVTEGKCWFTVQDIEAAPLNFSEVSDGRGLYCLPFAREQLEQQGRTIETAEIDFDAMHAALPLREDEHPVGLYDGENGTLLLALRTGSGIDLVVLNVDNEQVLQRFTLFGEELSDAEGWAFCPHGNQLYTSCDSGVRYYERGADGCYSLRLDAPNGAGDALPEEMAYRTYLNPSAIAWDGERLTVVTAGTGGYRYDYGNAGGALLLSVYDETGLRYCATLESGAMCPGANGFGGRVLWGAYSANDAEMFSLASDDGTWDAERVKAHEGVFSEPRGRDRSDAVIIGGADGPTAVLVAVEQRPQPLAPACLAVLAGGAVAVLSARKRKKKHK